MGEEVQRAESTGTLGIELETAESLTSAYDSKSRSFTIFHVLPLFHWLFSYEISENRPDLMAHMSGFLTIAYQTIGKDEMYEISI